MNFSELAMRNLRNLSRWMWAWYLRGGTDELAATDDKDYRGDDERRRGRDLEFRVHHIRQDMKGKKASRAVANLATLRIQRALRKKA